MRENTSTRLKQIMREQNLKQIDILNKSLPFQKKLGVKMGKALYLNMLVVNLTLININ